MWRWFAGGLIWAGCSGGDVMVPERPSAVLKAVGEVGWPQEGWYRPPPGFRLETLVRSGDHFIASWVHDDGDREAVRLEGPGEGQGVDPVVRPGAVAPMTAESDGGSVRVSLVSQGADLSVRVTDGQGSRELFTVSGDEPLTHPVLSSDGRWLYLRQGAPRASILRLPVAGGPAEVVARGVEGPHGVFERSGEPRVVFSDPGAGHALVVAEPPADTFLRATAFVGRVTLPGDLVPIVEGTEGAWLRVKGCDRVDKLSIRSDGARVTMGAREVSHGAACGPGCSVWYALTDAGDPRQVAQLSEERPGVYRAVLGSGFGLSSGVYAAGDVAAQLPTLEGCHAGVAQGLLLGRRVWSGQGVLDLVAVDGEGVDAVLAWGPEAGRSVRLRSGLPDEVRGEAPSGPSDPLETEDARGRRVWVEQMGVERRGPSGVVRDAEGRVVEEPGQAILREGEDGPPVELLAAATGRDLQGVVTDEGLNRVWYVDAGRRQGLYRAQLGVETVLPAWPMTGLGRPAAVRWEGGWAVALWREAGEGREEVWVVTPWRDADREAWRDGPQTLLDIEPRWVPVARRGGQWRRCRGPEIRLGADAQGGFLSVVSSEGEAERWPARGASWDDPVLRVIGEDEATPRLLATMGVQGESARWQVHARDGELRASHWRSWSAVGGWPAAEGGCELGDGGL